MAPKARDLRYRRALQLFKKSGVPFMVGGAYAMFRVTGLRRVTKDLDIFVRPSDVRPLLQWMKEQGYHTEFRFPHWLAKVFVGEGWYVDVIFNSGNGLCPVDDLWFEYAPRGRLFGVDVSFTPVEETIWSKSFVMERERFDGADVAHLVLAAGRRLDWERILARFEGNEAVLLSHLVLVPYLYPHRRGLVPPWVLDRLGRKAKRDAAKPGKRECRGTLLSRQYDLDVKKWGLGDPRRIFHS